MTRTTLLLLGAILLLSGLLGAPVLWPTEEVLPNLALRLILWTASSAGAVCVWLALAPSGPARSTEGHATRRFPGGLPHAA
ncbi:hypothetical protein ACE7GA_13525 [Roseomonas sp. CCTCC AB2023176]|uniref:hypothetical protein n=1 Tax=Roseomonas sp. CCTCC AB2023176 TaxID=3342640 RepID=UPI0035E26068